MVWRYGMKRAVQICEFNEDYFERGLMLGVSLYERYRWLPERIGRLACAVAALGGITPGERVIDVGCAKGYLVKALRGRGYDAWGCDISPYAIAHVPREAKLFCVLSKPQGPLPFQGKFQLAVCKDVLEHNHPLIIKRLLTSLGMQAKSMVVIIPLGDRGIYRIPAYQGDVTHRVAEDEKWWVRLFRESGWKTSALHYRVAGIKDNWQKWSKGNAIFVLDHF